MKHKIKRTKIVATIGPASQSIEVMTQLLKAGVDVFRINSSHGSNEMKEQIIRNVLQVNKDLGTHAAILVDLQGPKLRVGVMPEEGVELVEGRKIILTNEECQGSAERLYVNYHSLPQDARPGERILLDDGKLELEVLSIDSAHEITAIVKAGGILTSKKGVNLPHTKISLPSLTDKDLEDLDFALTHGADWIGLSFVRTAEDIRALKELIKAKGYEAMVIAKIEKPEALKHIDAIIKEADGLMVARGDLGVETDMAKVICYNAVKMARQVDAHAIITMTHSGYTAFKISSYRPSAGIFVFTDNPGLLRRLNLLWGVQAFLYNKYLGTDETIIELKTDLKKGGYLKPGDWVINIASMPLQEKGRANMMKLSIIE